MEGLQIQADRQQQFDKQSSSEQATGKDTSCKIIDPAKPFAQTIESKEDLMAAFSDMVSCNAQTKIDEATKRYSFKFVSDLNPTQFNTPLSNPSSRLPFGSEDFLSNRGQDTSLKPQLQVKWDLLKDSMACKVPYQHAEQQMSEEKKPRMSLAGVEKGFSFLSACHNGKDSPFTSTAASSNFLQVPFGRETNLLDSTANSSAMLDSSATISVLGGSIINSGHFGSFGFRGSDGSGEMKNNNQSQGPVFQKAQVVDSDQQQPIIGRATSSQSLNDREDENYEDDSQFEAGQDENQKFAPKILLNDDTELRDSITHNEGKINQPNLLKKGSVPITANNSRPLASEIVEEQTQITCEEQKEVALSCERQSTVRKLSQCSDNGSNKSSGRKHELHTRYSNQEILQSESAEPIPFDVSPEQQQHIMFTKDFSPEMKAEQYPKEFELQQQLIGKQTKFGDLKNMMMAPPMADIMQNDVQQLEAQFSANTQVFQEVAVAAQIPPSEAQDQILDNNDHQDSEEQKK